jgi:uncharacterized RDD family membrane protein YckC
MEENNICKNNILDSFQKKYGSKPQVTLGMDDFTDLVEHQRLSTEGMDYVNPEEQRQAEAINKEAVTLLEEGHFNEAIIKLRQAAKLDNDNPYILVNIARCYVEMGVYEVAIDYCQKALQLEPHNKWVKSYLKHAIYLFEHQDEAILTEERKLHQYDCLTERIVAHFIDRFIFTFIFTIIIYKISTSWGMVFNDMKILSMLYAGSFLYWLIQEWLMQGSIGKMIMGLRIVRIDQEKPRFLDYLKRTFARFIGDTLIIAYLSVKNTPRYQRVGDLWARTTVARKKSKKVQYHFDYNV